MRQLAFGRGERCLAHPPSLASVWLQKGAWRNVGVWRNGRESADEEELLHPWAAYWLDLQLLHAECVPFSSKLYYFHSIYYNGRYLGTYLNSLLK